MTPGDDLLPPNATPLERAISGAGARMLTAPVQAIRQARQPLTCSAQFVPYLCWERSTRRYSPTDLAFNRERAQNAFNEHLTAGTPPAVEEEIAFDTGQSVRILDYWEAGLAWPYFAVLSVINPGDSMPDMDALLASALARKNVRDMPQPRIFGVQPAAQAFSGAGQGVVISATLVIAQPHTPQIYAGAGAGVLISAKLIPIGAAA